MSLLNESEACRTLLRCILDRSLLCCEAPMTWRHSGNGPSARSRAGRRAVIEHLFD